MGSAGSLDARAGRGSPHHVVRGLKMASNTWHGEVFSKPQWMEERIEVLFSVEYKLKAVSITHKSEKNFVGSYPNGNRGGIVLPTRLLLEKIAENMD